MVFAKLRILKGKCPCQMLKSDGSGFPEHGLLSVPSTPCMDGSDLPPAPPSLFLGEVQPSAITYLRFSGVCPQMLCPCDMVIKPLFGHLQAGI